MGLKLKVVQIGNSQGIRLPKPLLEECGIKKEVEVETVDGVITLRPVRKQPREGWAESFREMASQGDDDLLMDIDSDFDGREWQWK